MVVAVAVRGVRAFVWRVKQRDLGARASRSLLPSTVTLRVRVNVDHPFRLIRLVSDSNLDKSRSAHKKHEAMEDYLARRNELIARDRALRPDAAVVSTSAEEAQADKILRSIRSAEAETIWSPKREVRHVHGSSQMFPGMEFLTGT